MNDFKILVVEDDRPVSSLITTTLKIHDYSSKRYQHARSYPHGLRSLP